MTNVDPAVPDEPEWLDLTTPADRERFHAMPGSVSQVPLPAGAYRDRVRPKKRADAPKA